MKEIIGLSGFAQSGKDTAAAVLVNEFGFTRVSFADKLRKAMYALNPMLGCMDEDGYFVDTIYLQDVIDDVGWEGVKSTHHADEVRRLLQRGGTEMGRNVLGQNIWVDATLRELPDKAVLSDCRFINELDGVVNVGGYVWRINRTGVDALNDHPSETEAINYDKFSLVLENNGTQEQFESLVQSVYVSGRYKEWCYQ